MADNVQLKREELVGNDVVLENINPKTNTGSIINDPDGTDLNETINRIWNAINDNLSRIVNSVNGRTGAVVINSSDVGLGRVDNVSFADIQEWVLNRLKLEFENKKLHLYETMDAVEDIVASNDAAYINTPFYAKRGWVSSPITAYPSYLAYMGYFYWDTVTDHLKCSYKAINVVGITDNSIIYNEATMDEMYGMLRVNIWNNPTNALEIKNPTSSKSDSGLWINPAKINPAMYFYKGCYGVNGDVDHPETDAFLDITNTAEASREVEISIDGVALSMACYLNETSFKIGDIIICQFSDENYRHYDALEGSYKLNTGINSTFVDTAPKIGQVTDIYDPDDLTNHPNFKIQFFSIKPYVDFGLGYYIPDEANQLDTSVLGVKTVTGRIDDDSVTSNTNMSGINVIASIANNKKEYIKNEFNTVTPAGPTKTVYRNTDVDATIDGISSGVTIVPDMSMNVIPSKNFGKGDEGLLPNWPLKTAGNVDDKTNNQTAEKDITYLGINLDKLVSYKTSETIDGNTFVVDKGFYYNGAFYTTEERTTTITGTENGRYIDLYTGDVYIYNGSAYVLSDRKSSEFINPTSNAINASGLTILDSSDKSGNSSYTAHSGGLAVNVGDFLEIGNLGPTANYYNNGKVNVRIDESKGLCNVQDENLNYTNKIGVKIDQTSGLAFNSSGTLKNNTGLGMRISKYDSGAVESLDADRFIAPSINDIEPDIVETIDGMTTDNINFFGGMRYIHNDQYSTIGARINDWEFVYNGEPIRHGSEGLRITDNNVLGVQPCKDSVVTIKHLEEYLNENFAWTTILPLPTVIFNYEYWTGSEPDLRNAIVDAYNSFKPINKYKLQQPERCYVVKSKSGTTRRYVYVGPPAGSGTAVAPTIDDYEPIFEFFATQEQFDLKYPSTYVQLTDVSQPADWNTDWVRYYRKSGDSYVRVTDVSKPTYVADEFYRRDALDRNGNPPNRDKVYVIGLYGTIYLKTWGPKRTLLYPDVDSSPVTVQEDLHGDGVDIVSAVDATKTRIEAENLTDPNTSRSLNDEAELRADFNCSGTINTVDSSRILKYVADIAGDSNYTSEFIEVKKKPRYWNKQFTPSDPTTYTYSDANDAFEMCYGRFYIGDDHTTQSVAVYYVKNRQNNNYIGMQIAYPDNFTQGTAPDFNHIDTSNYDGKVYTKAYFGTAPMENLRAWNAAQPTPVVEPMFTDELTDLETHTLIDVNTNIIYDYESGVDVLYSKTRGLTKTGYNAGYGLAINITDNTTVSPSAEQISTNKYVNGALRFCSGGKLAVRINDSNDYDPDYGSGDDDLSVGTAGLCISKANVLGVQIQPKSMGGLTFDENGNLVITGFAVMYHEPADWNTAWTNYYRYAVALDTYYSSDADREYRMNHVTADDFSPVPSVVEYVELETEPADFDPEDYYKEIQTGIYVRGQSTDTWAGYTWYDRQESAPPFVYGQYYTRFANI